MAVATREGGVDRNDPVNVETKVSMIVATREGGVDRNVSSLVSSIKD